MASLQASNLLFTSSSSSSSSCRSSNHRINAAISFPRIHLSPQKTPSKNLVEELKIRDVFAKSILLVEKNQNIEPVVSTTTTIQEEEKDSMVTAQLYAILEAVSDRVEMHTNIGQQRDNWNTLLLNSINMISLAAVTMTGIAATGGAGDSILALKLSSTILFSAVTGLLTIMNKIQPSQLAEEQRNATRLFKQLQSEIQSVLALRSPTKQYVEDTMDKVLKLDQAYPLPLLGKMIEKFPKSYEPAVWWPSNDDHFHTNKVQVQVQVRPQKNGWSEELEREMREIAQVLKRKDSEDYVKLGNLALKINKALAISGPLLTGIAAVGSATVGSSHWAPAVAVAAGAVGSIVNTLEHGGQVGMVFEMYRNTGGFFKLLEESIESNLKECELDKRENGEMFEMKVAIKLGRSLSQLRNLATKSRYCHIKGAEIDEFASKLF